VFGELGACDRHAAVAGDGRSRFELRGEPLIRGICTEREVPAPTYRIVENRRESAVGGSTLFAVGVVVDARGEQWMREANDSVGNLDHVSRLCWIEHAQGNTEGPNQLDRQAPMRGNEQERRPGPFIEGSDPRVDESLQLCRNHQGHGRIEGRVCEPRTSQFE
jgi:hypothetical protein